VRRVVLNEDDKLLAKFEDEVNTLLEEIQTANNLLRRLMNQTVSTRGEDKWPQRYFETILYATNLLVEAQLGLSSAIVHTQNKDEEPVPVKTQRSRQHTDVPEKYNLDDQVQENIPEFQPNIKGKPNKWLLIVGVSVVLLGVAWFFFNSRTNALPVMSANVKTVDPRFMPGGAGLITARVSENTLYGFVRNDWNAQSQQQSKLNLKLLLEEGSKYDYNKVLLINQDGALVGNASETEIKIL
jgi:hypothetical protein